MKKGLIIGGVIVGVIVVLVMMFAGTYNGLVSKEEEVEGKLADISVQLERRADLIPNLVSTVKGYAAHEKEVIDSITTSREKLLNAGSAEEMAEANQDLTNAINNLLVIVENYPDLKANTNFVDLQNQLKDVEEKISYARQFYNDSVLMYNNKVEMVPSNIVASIFGFKKETFFEADEKERENVKVKF